MMTTSKAPVSRSVASASAPSTPASTVASGVDVASTGRPSRPVVPPHAAPALAPAPQSDATAGTTQLARPRVDTGAGPHVPFAGPAISPHLMPPASGDECDIWANRDLCAVSVTVAAG